MARPRKLEDHEVRARLASVPEWTLEAGTIRRTFDCGTFPRAVAFVAEVAFAAEAMNHHPDLDVRWKRVTAALVTHDAGGLTELDFELARRIDAIAARGAEAASRK